jgi:hypothetical protein
MNMNTISPFMNIQNFEDLFSKIPNIFLSLPPSLSLAPCLCVFLQQEEKKKRGEKKGFQKSTKQVEEKK